MLATDVTALESRRRSRSRSSMDGRCGGACAGCRRLFADCAPPPRPGFEVGDRLPSDAERSAADAVTVRGNNFEAIAGAVPARRACGGGNVGAGAVAACGERLRASDIAALAALGVSIIHARKPNIRIAVTNPKLGHGIAGALLKRAIEAAGGAATIISDLPLERALLDEGADAVFVVGGTGQGKRDASVTALARVAVSQPTVRHCARLDRGLGKPGSPVLCFQKAVCGTCVVCSWFKSWRGYWIDARQMTVEANSRAKCLTSGIAEWSVRA